MRNSKFLQDYLNFRKLLHYDLPDQHYLKTKFHHYFQKLVKFLLVTNASMFCWSTLYFLVSSEIYAAVIIIAILAIIITPFHKIGTYVGILSLVPLLIGLSYNVNIPF